MRLWHKDFIHVLPGNLLDQQWLDCIEIAKNIAQTGEPGDKYVNGMMRYSLAHFKFYCDEVEKALEERGKTPDREILDQWLVPAMKQRGAWGKEYVTAPRDPTQLSEVFRLWHNVRYWRQCAFIMEEMYDCQIISREDWIPISRIMVETVIENRRRFRK